jgi:ABC-type multidrug transport system fused ATPase/permease subunit
MIETFRKLRDLLSPRERWGLYLLLVILLVGGFFEMFGIASVLPFMAVLSQPERIETQPKLHAVYEGLGFTSTDHFLIFLGLGSFVFVLVGVVAHVLSLYAIARFSNMRSYTISSRLLRGYLHQPYAWFLNRHSADLGKTILNEVDSVVSHTMIPVLKMVSNSFIALFIVVLLVLLQPWVALATAGLLGSCYAVILLVARKYLTHFGRQRFHATRQRYRIAMEATGGIKDVKLLGLEDAYLRRYQIPSRQSARANTYRSVIAESPRYLLQGLAFGGMLLMILVLLFTGDGRSLAGVLPLLAVYAFAGLRLLPAMQQIYSEITMIRFNRPALDSLHEDMKEVEASRQDLPPEAARVEPVRLAERLELVDAHYSYPLAERPALRGLSLSIPARATVGIVGGTGAGKTTAVDIILGLLELERGRLEADGVPIDRTNMRAWQNSIGYVPQAIFLTDDTVAANIAFGLPAGKIDRAAVERAARIAELHRFVTEELPQGYDTPVGERGVRLSGGQRQRIGIARALYNDPDVLIMDEATSALDNLTERAVMDAVHNLGHAKTIILIAHRLTTVEACDIIFMIEHGRLVAQGSYRELLEKSGKFRAMAVGEPLG